MMFTVVVEKLGEDRRLERVEDTVSAPNRAKLMEQLIGSRHFIDESARVYSPVLLIQLEAEGIVREIRNAQV
jgi:hypothetical protein